MFIQEHIELWLSTSKNLWTIQDKFFEDVLGGSGGTVDLGDMIIETSLEIIIYSRYAAEGI